MLLAGVALNVAHRHPRWAVSKSKTGEVIDHQAEVGRKGEKDGMEGGRR
jgi:hypothetical protein